MILEWSEPQNCTLCVALNDRKQLAESKRGGRTSDSPLPAAMHNITLAFLLQVEQANRNKVEENLQRILTDSREIKDENSVLLEKYKKLKS